MYSRSREDECDLSQAGALEVLRLLQSNPGHTDSYLLERASRLISRTARNESRYGRAVTNSLDTLPEEQEPPAPAPPPNIAAALARARPDMNCVEHVIHRARYEDGLSVTETIRISGQARATVFRIQQSIAAKYRANFRRLGVTKRSDL